MLVRDGDRTVITMAIDFQGDVKDFAVVIPVRGDKRSLFLVPWGERPDGTFRHTYVGTTDTDYDGALDDPQPQVNCFATPGSPSPHDRAHRSSENHARNSDT